MRVINVFAVYPALEESLFEPSEKSLSFFFFTHSLLLLQSLKGHLNLASSYTQKGGTGLKGNLLKRDPYYTTDPKRCKAAKSLFNGTILKHTAISALNFLEHISSRIR